MNPFGSLLFDESRAVVFEGKRKKFFTNYILNFIEY
jgi:hypothetical protein